MTSKWCRHKAVVVAVYAEKPRGQGVRHHHHHHYHHIHTNASRSDGRVRGYNRRSELLNYARHLRAPAAHSTASLPSHPSSHTKQPSTVEILPGDGTRKQKRTGHPTCFDRWSFVMTRFLRSMTALKTTKDEEKKSHKKVSTTTKMKALVKSLQVQKKGSFLSKLLASLKKRR